MRDSTHGVQAAILASYIGQPAQLTVKDLRIDVKIEDARVSYGNMHLRITPVRGMGTEWVGAERLTITGPRGPYGATPFHPTKWSRCPSEATQT